MTNIGVIETKIFDSLKEIEKNLILIQDNLKTEKNSNIVENSNIKKISNTKKIKKIKKSIKVSQKNEKDLESLNWERETNDIPESVNKELIRSEPIKKKKRRKPRKKIAFSNYVVDTSSSSDD